MWLWMSQIILFECEDCGFEWEEENYFFYQNKEGEYVETPLLMLTAGDIEHSPIRVNVYRTYCNDCDKIIKIYSIDKYPDSIESAINTVKNNTGNDAVILSDNKNLDNLECPSCKGKLFTLRENNEYTSPDKNDCPKCGGKFKISSIIMSD